MLFLFARLGQCELILVQIVTFINVLLNLKNELLCLFDLIVIVNGLEQQVFLQPHFRLNLFASFLQLSAKLCIQHSSTLCEVRFGLVTLVLSVQEELSQLKQRRRQHRLIISGVLFTQLNDVLELFLRCVGVTDTFTEFCHSHPRVNFQIEQQQVHLCVIIFFFGLSRAAVLNQLQRCLQRIKCILDQVCLLAGLRALIFLIVRLSKLHGVDQLGRRLYFIFRFLIWVILFFVAFISLPLRVRIHALLGQWFNIPKLISVELDKSCQEVANLVVKGRKDIDVLLVRHCVLVLAQFYQ